MKSEMLQFTFCILSISAENFPRTSMYLLLIGSHRHLSCSL